MMTKLARIVLCGILFSTAGISLSVADETVKDVIKVEVTGTLSTGLMAVGGETTGTTITANGVTWELDFRDTPELQALANRHNGSKVTVVGIYQRRRGVEIPRREIVTVTTLTPAPAKPKPAGAG